MPCIRGAKINLVVHLAFALLLISCAIKRDGSDNGKDTGSDVTEWKEMDEFHMIMAETFHPYKDSADLEPVRSRAAELMTAADRWASSPLPAKVDSPEMQEKLKQLRSQAAALAASVTSQDDNVIGEQLTKLHDTFHAIQDGWYRAR